MGPRAALCRMENEITKMIKDKNEENKDTKNHNSQWQTWQKINTYDTKEVLCLYHRKRAAEWINR